MFNQFIGIGNLTADPEIKYHDGGGSKTRFAIAINRPGKKDEVLFLNCECWDKLAESVAEYARKGRKVLIAGELKMDSYEDRDGNKRQAWYINCREVRFLDSARTEEGDDRGRGSRDDRGRGGRDDDRGRGREDDRRPAGRSEARDTGRSDRGRSRPAAEPDNFDDLPF